MQFAISDDRGADRNRGIHVAVPADITHRPGIDAPPHRLEFTDDLHGPDLGCSGHGARREGRAQHIDGVEIILKFPRHIGHDMHHMRIAFHLHF